MTAMTALSDMSRALGTAISIKESFAEDPPNPGSFGANLTDTDRNIQQFNLTGCFRNQGDNMNFIQFLESAGSMLDRNRVFDHLTKDNSKECREDLIMMVNQARSEPDPSIVACIDNFLKLCGTSITKSVEKSRKKNLILAFAEVFGETLRLETVSGSSSSSSTVATMESSMSQFKQKVLIACTTGNTQGPIALGEEGVRVTADLCFSILLLAQAFHKGIYFDETLLQDFHGRINAIEVGSRAEDVPIEDVRAIFDKVKALESISVGIIEKPNLPSYFFGTIEHKNEIDWSFNDGAAFSNNTAISTNDSIYIFDSSDSSHPRYCIPYMYVRFELEDANTNILHLYPLGNTTFPIIFLESSECSSNSNNNGKSTIYYTSSTWIEFDTTAIALEWLSYMEKFALTSTQRNKKQRGSGNG